MNIGRRLSSLRAARGLSQGDIEKRTRLLRCYVSRVENGHTSPTLDTLEKWAAALEVEFYQLFYEGEGKPGSVTAASIKSEDFISDRERELLNLYRQAASDERSLIVEVARRTVRKAA